MDIRFVNKRNQIINASKLSIMTSGNYLIGMNDRGNQVIIEECESKEKAEAMMKIIIMRIDIGYAVDNLLIDLRGYKKEEEEE